MTLLRTRAVAAGGATLLTLGAGLVLAPLMAPAAASSVNTSPTYSLPQDPSYNQVSYWEDEYDADCTKIESSASWDGDVYTLGSYADVLVLKSSAGEDANSVWEGAAAGQYGVPDGQDISHIIVCDVEDETATPTPTETETGTPTPTETETGTPTPTETTPTETPTDPATTTPATTDPATTDPATTTPATSDPAPAVVPGLAQTGSSSNWALVASGLALLAAGAGLLGLSRRSGSHA